MAKKDVRGRSLSIASCGIKRKLKIAFLLMSILPFLLYLYLVSAYILPRFSLDARILVFLISGFVISLMGFLVIKEMLDRLLAISADVRLIAAGEIDREVTALSEDELGELGGAINQLTQRIRGTMDELKSYGERTTEINFEIQKRVLALSNLLQISSMVSQGAKLDDILHAITEKVRLLGNSDLSFLLLRDENKDLFSMRSADGPNSASLLRMKLDSQEVILDKTAKTHRPFIVDKSNKLSTELYAEFSEKFKTKNALFIPVFLKGAIGGILGIGNNREHFSYSKDDVELLDIFAKQVSIALENEALLHKIEKLEVKDVLTGLFNETYIRTRLKEEIRRAIAYQRPCSFMLLNIDNFQKFHNTFGTLEAEMMLKKISSLIKDSVTEIDRVARIGDNEFAILVPEKNKRQAQEMGEYIRKKIEFTFGEEPDLSRRMTISGGISENPLDGIEAEELVLKARELLMAAKGMGKNKIVGVKERTCQSGG